jgi:uncharacterized repeat protein (TIGR04052 family)
VAGSAIVRDLQVYVHDVELLDEHGKPHPFRFAAAPPWQSERVALIDLVGEGRARQAAIQGMPEPGAPATFSGIRFTVGVPFELNHGNPLSAPPPLDRGDMFWSWQSGHKFLRVDLAADAREWSFHLGSTGCSSASALRPPAAQCAQPNRMRVELKGDPLRNVVRFDVSALASAARAANYITCTGNYTGDPACTDAYSTTGLRPESGVCSDEHCSGQRLWKLQ